MHFMSEELPPESDWLCVCGMPNEALEDEAAEMESAMRFAQAMEELRRQHGVVADSTLLGETVIKSN